MSDETCNDYSGQLNCGCCETTSAFCLLRKGHTTQHMGEFYEYTIMWPLKTEEVKK